MTHLAQALNMNQVRRIFLLCSHPTVTMTTDTYNTESFVERDRCCKCGASGSRIAGEPGETDIRTLQ